MAATSEQEEFEFRRRAEAEAAYAPPKAKRGGYLSDMGRAAWNLPMSTAETLKGTMMLPVEAAKAAFHPGQTAQAMGRMLQEGKDIVGGMAQQYRNLSPPEMRGTAPAMSTAPAQRFEAQFTPQNMSREFGNNPAPALLMAAPVAGAALKGTRLGAALSTAGSKLNPVPPVGRLLDAGATPAAERVRAAALGKVLAQRQTIAQTQAKIASVKAADTPLRAQMDAAAQAQAAAGVGVSDIPEAQSLVAFLKGQLNPRGKVVTVPTSEQARLYRDVISTLTTKGGKAPSLETVQNLRRRIQEPVHGDPMGYSAISDIERGKLAKDLHDVENAYTGGLSEPVRANYAGIPDRKAAKRMEKQDSVFMTQAALLDKLPPAAAAEKAVGIVTALSRKGMISKAEYDEFLDLANAATTAADKAKFRKRLALALTAAAGFKASDAALGGHITGIIP